MADKIKVIIVDDENHARTILRELISSFFPELEIVGEGKSLPEAIELIHSTHPHLVFLDIEMPGYSGLQIKDFINNDRGFEIVFVTAYDKFAIDALRISAFDYLLKPIQLDELEKCIERFKKNKPSSNFKTTMDKLETLDVNLSSKQLKKLVLQTHQGIHYFDFDKIIYVEASGMYSVLHTAEGQFVASKPLKELEESLNSFFFRIHRSYIVNVNFVVKYSGKEGGVVTLSNQSSLPLARNRKDGFLEYLQKHSE